MTSRFGFQVVVLNLRFNCDNVALHNSTFAQVFCEREFSVVHTAFYSLSPLDVLTIRIVKVNVTMEMVTSTLELCSM